jgi:hypothetical protein
MIYQFETRAGGRITYTSTVGSQLLHIIGKQPGPRGVIEVADLPAAIGRLEAAVAREKEMNADARRDLDPHARNDSADDADEDRDREPPVSLGQRVFPLLDLLKYALQVREDVTWGL